MKILMVCLGNICRSPLAEGVMQNRLDVEHTVDSAGTIDFHKGKSPDKRSILVAKEKGIDISKQRSRPITSDDLERFDYIFCMDRSNYENVLNMAKNQVQKSKIHLFLEFAELGKKDVPDPYYGEVSDFENVYQLLNDASEIVVKKLLNS